MPAPTRILDESLLVSPQEHEARTANPGLNFYPDSLTLLAPKDFDLPHFLKDYPRFKGYQDNIYWFLSKIIRLHFHYNLPPSSYVNIHSKTIEAHTHPSVSKPIQNVLLEHGVIQCDGIWRRNEKSMGWRIGEAYRIGVKTVTITKPALIKRITQDRLRVAGATVAQDRLQGVHAGLYAWLQRTEINQPLADKLAVNTTALPEFPN